MSRTARPPRTRLRVDSFVHAVVEPRPRSSLPAGALLLLYVHAGQVVLRGPGRPIATQAGDLVLLPPGACWELVDERLAAGPGSEVISGPPLRLLTRPPPGIDRASRSVVSALGLVLEDGGEVIGDLPACSLIPAAGSASAPFAGLVELLDARVPLFGEDPAIVMRTLELAVLAFSSRERMASSARETSSLVRRAVDLMSASLHVRWHVGSLATRVGLSRSSFAAQFTAEIGEPPLQYLRRLRLRDAAARIARGEGPLKRVAAEVGYDSLAAFCKAFRLRFGMSPGEFRSRGQKVEHHESGGEMDTSGGRWSDKVVACALSDRRR